LDTLRQFGSRVLDPIHTVLANTENQSKELVFIDASLTAARKMIPFKLTFCVIAALFAAVTVISGRRRDAAATINCAIITGLSLITMEWA
jgi:hypothetical protein